MYIQVLQDISIVIIWANNYHLKSNDNKFQSLNCKICIKSYAYNKLSPDIEMFRGFQIAPVFLIIAVWRHTVGK